MSGADIFDKGGDNPQAKAFATFASGGTYTGAGGPAASDPESRADALVAAEQQRSERQRVEGIQRQLRLETMQRTRGFGLRSLLGTLGGGRSSLLGAG